MRRPLGFRSTEIDLDAVWGSSAASELHERILAARSPEAAFAVLEEVLLARLNGRWLPHPAVAHAMGVFGAVQHRQTVGQVVEEVGLSQRRFIALFDRAVGLTPKLFCRVRRFQDALGQVGHRPDWADVAAACGYADQAHLIRDFRAFSGLTPGEYLRFRTDQQNHVSLGPKG